MRGTITFYNNQRGFGFITVPSGEQYFFHISNFIKDEGEVPILEGRVRFDVGPAVAVGKKPQALHVQYIHDKPAMQSASEIFAAKSTAEGTVGGAQ